MWWTPQQAAQGEGEALHVRRKRKFDRKQIKNIFPFHEPHPPVFLFQAFQREPREWGQKNSASRAHIEGGLKYARKYDDNEKQTTKKN